MENVQNYDDFLNEGFLSKSILALSLAASTLFTNIEANAGTIITGKHNTETPIKRAKFSVNFETIEDNYLEVMGTLLGLSRHVNDPDLKILIEEMSSYRVSFRDFKEQDFQNKMNTLKPKLIKVIKKYGKSDYKIEQIFKHIEKKDYIRLSVDFQYIKDKFDEISSNRNITGWEKTDSALQIIIILLGILISIFIGSVFTPGLRTVFNGERDRLRRWREEREQYDRDPEIIVNFQDDPPVVAKKTKKSKSPFKPGEKITFENPKSIERNGKSATFLGIREDGKYRIQFADGSILAAIDHHVKPYNPTREQHIKEDPYGEENWDN